MVRSCHRRQTCTRSLVDTLWGWKGVAPPSGLPSCRPYSRVRVLALWIPQYLPVPTVRSGQWVSPLIGLLVTGQSCFMVTFSVTMKHDWPATSKVFVPDWHSLIIHCTMSMLICVGSETILPITAVYLTLFRWLVILPGCCCVSHVTFFASTFLMCVCLVMLWCQC